MPTPRRSFWFRGVRVVEEDEVGLSLPVVGEVPGAEVLGEKDGGILPFHQRRQRLPGQGLSLPGPGGEAEVHAEPLNVQGQPSRAPGLGHGLLEVLGEASAGDGGAEKHRRAGGGARVALGEEQRPPGGGERRRQGGDKGRPVPPGGLLKVQQHAGVAPPPALPQHRVPQILRAVDEGGLAVADG